MCEATAVIAAFGMVQQHNAAKQQKKALKRANKAPPVAPTQASAGVRDAAIRARRRAAAGSRFSRSGSKQ
ncbi:MAG: hypothetical protein KZQ94_20850 [Candidatus Thiodiazotropha sp. (ex Troendleina suluensis)]|nr:hypothetical protein [Candidatus Thiodiazotropha sp. (ex Troendleina suluensis)]